MTPRGSLSAATAFCPRIALCASVGFGLLALALPAHAVEQPRAGRLDSRIRTVPYEPGNVVDLWTAPGAVMVIQFSAKERVVNVAASDSATLKAQPSGNFLFLKPMGDLKPQPVVVLTQTAGGQLRRYNFEFETRKSDLGPGANVDYTVVFTYPHDAYLRRRAAERAAWERREREAAWDRLHGENTAVQTLSPYDGTRNYRYVARGDRALAPRWVWDNGYSTAFVFPAMQRIPSLYRIDPDGKEATADYSVHGDTVIAPGTAAEWRLRDGRTVLEVYDLAYSPIGLTPGTHTVSPHVQRVLRTSVDAR